ncbi:hypothetical protein [Acetobacter senegalensis]|uniref:hypothetical protein n=1 Tax=Acetobacter senegalensis TaxID=446692 RepID=UPI001EDA75D0|nr:hypothetical protein [Acetobacter senegalensis]MCG4256955.1 hypothetical protein [Acetobacter senegalensis]MCG4266907.1 hypothetical protein [Acetobacter senegalensis]
MIKSRRNFLRTAGLLACGTALAACTVTKSGNVTSVTLNVAKVDAYAQAAKNFAGTILSVPLVTSALGSGRVTIINACVTGIVVAIDQFDSAANGAATVSYDSTSVKTAVNSVIADLQTVLTYAKQGISGIESTASTADTISKVNMAISAAETVLSLLTALIVSVGVARMAPTPMSEASALAVLGV